MRDTLFYIQEFNTVSIVLRLFFAATIGALIGMERSSRHQVAGLRTFSLVCLGSALAQIVDLRCVAQMGTGDPLRLAQGVINGIGFLGVGTIIVTRENHIKGLTTAATLWITAVLGICIGSGYVLGSVLAFFLVLVIIKFLAYWSRRLERYSQDIDMVLEVKDQAGVREVMEFMRKAGYRILLMEKTQFDGYLHVHMEVNLGRRQDHYSLVDALYKLESVDYVQENN